jgi:uncharacterized phage-associated protein
MKYAPIAAANWFLTNHGAQGIEHMKLQKLVYCAHGWWLAFKPEAFLNERPQVWKYGPVFSSLYHILKPFGRRPISEPQAPGPFEQPPSVGNENDFADLFHFVWKRYGHMSSFELSELTHEKNSAWYKQAECHGFSVAHGLEIPDEYVRSEFVGIYNDENFRSKSRSDAA